MHFQAFQEHLFVVPVLVYLKKRKLKWKRKILVGNMFLVVVVVEGNLFGEIVEMKKD